MTAANTCEAVYLNDSAETLSREALDFSLSSTRANGNVLSIKIREEKVGIHMKENHEEWLDLLKSNQIDPKGKVELELELEMELGLWLERELELGLELEYQSSRSEVESHEWESDIPRHLQRHWGQGIINITNKSIGEQMLPDLVVEVKSDLVVVLHGPETEEDPWMAGQWRLSRAEGTSKTD
ncbi:hypothetical protein RJ641_029060 [Dillenia turbinata]|uniref:Uncharacterized protein n=1 Tax=Dillenia turbinata TaxID=194707 RepID=A0AAN8VXH4_9MAGN